MSVAQSLSEYKRQWYLKNRERLASLARERYRKNREIILARTSAYHLANRKAQYAKHKEWCAANRDRVAELGRKYRSGPRGIVARAAYVKANRHKCAAGRAKWRKAHPSYHSAAHALREARKIQAQPKWADKAEIFRLYQLSAMRTKETGIQHSVDHVVPLRHRLVCGLHCEANLQILTKSENSIKHNKFVVE